MKPRATTIIRKDRDGREIAAVNAMWVYGAIRPAKQWKDWVVGVKVGRARGFDFFLLPSQDETRSIPDTFLSVEMVEELADESGLSVHIRGDDLKISDRMTTQLTSVTPTSSDQIVGNSGRERLALALVEANQIIIGLDAKVAETAPKAAALDLISSSKGSLTLSDAAKEMKMQPICEFVPWLFKMGWIFKRDRRGDGEWIANQEMVNRGRMDHGENRYWDASDESYKLSPQARITAKGRSALAMIFATPSGQQKYEEGLRWWKSEVSQRPPRKARKKKNDLLDRAA